MLRPSLPVALLAFLVLPIGLSVPVMAQTLSGEGLVDALRGGGYVLLMRHASSPHEPPAASEADPANTGRERQLDETGRATAAAMGQAMRTLHIPIGTVLSSPTFRALQTVRLAGFGQPETHEELSDGGHSMSDQAVAAWASWLRDQVARMPETGTNTIIVTHYPNIASAFPEDVKGLSDGEALVFHPDGTGGAQLVAHVKVGEWPRLAGGH